MAMGFSSVWLEFLFKIISYGTDGRCVSAALD